jgi:hypothetical protein
VCCYAAKCAREHTARSIALKWRGTTSQENARFTALGIVNPINACFVHCEAACVELARHTKRGMEVTFEFAGTGKHA